MDNILGMVQEFTGSNNSAPSTNTAPNEGAYNAAAQHAGADPDTFKQAMNSFNPQSAQGPPADHEVQHMQDSHDQIYGQNGGVPTSQHSDAQLGSAAALQAFQNFNSSGSGGGVQDLLGMAMGEGMKLFSAQGGSGDQSAIIQQASMMAMKLYMGKQSGGGGPMSMLKMFM